MRTPALRANLRIRRHDHERNTGNPAGESRPGPARHRVHGRGVGDHRHRAGNAYRIAAVLDREPSVQAEPCGERRRRIHRECDPIPAVPDSDGRADPGRAVADRRPLHAHRCAISLSIAAVPFFARIAESAFSEVDPGLLEAAISTGATTRQIIVDAIFPQALPSFIRGVVLTIISLIGYSAMVGTIGAGGIGDMAIQYGYNRYETGVLVVIVIILIVIVQIIQWIGDWFARKVTH